MSLMPKIKGMFIKIERFKMKSCPSQKKMTRVCKAHLILFSLVVGPKAGPTYKPLGLP